MLSRLVLAAVLFLSAPTAAGEVAPLDRFQLWNDCRPTRLVVEGLSDDAAALGLTEGAIATAVRSRLRSAWLYTDDEFEASWSVLYVNVNVVGGAFSLSIEFRKLVQDDATAEVSLAATWHTGAAGTHAQRAEFILSGVAQHTDHFIDEYLGVNEDACVRR